MCTCCAAPVPVGLRQAGASPQATLAYWLVNPTLNPVTLILIGWALGCKWLALPFATGVLLVCGGGFLIAGSADLDRMSISGRLGSEASPVGELDLRETPWRRWSAHHWRPSISLIPEYLIMIFLFGGSGSRSFSTSRKGPHCDRRALIDSGPCERRHAVRSAYCCTRFRSCRLRSLPDWESLPLRHFLSPCRQ
jgi:uncharacterized protein